MLIGLCFIAGGAILAFPRLGAHPFYAYLLIMLAGILFVLPYVLPSVHLS